MTIAATGVRAAAVGSVRTPTLPIATTGSMIDEERRRRHMGRARTCTTKQEFAMPRGDKSSYTDKQKRQAEHIEEGYEHRGVPEAEAERRAWATVNKQDHGGKKSGSGVGKPRDTSSSYKGGRLGGQASASRPAA